jgi:LPXTG-motif cell wall-anchored protein
VLAQSGAGDEQYVDPLAGSGSSGGGGSGSSGSSGSSSGTSSGTTSGSSSGQVAPSTSSGTTGTTSGTTASGTTAGQLPRTGLDLRLPIGAGIVLLAAGLLLWRRRPGDGRA